MLTRAFLLHSTAEPHYAEVHSATVFERAGFHDVAKIRVADSDAHLYATGTPATFFWGKSGDGRRAIRGYVDSAGPVASSGRDGRGWVDITFVGASWVFKQAGQRVWQNTTLRQVIRELATEHRFSFRTDSTSLRFAQLIQHGQSDWAFLRHLAEQHGMLLRADNTQLTLVDPLQELARTLSTTPILSVDRPADARIRTLSGGNAGIGDGFGKTRNRVSYGVDEVSKEVVATRAHDRANTTVNTPIFTEYPVLAESSIAGLRDQMRAVARKNFYANEIEVEVTNLPRFRIGNGVCIIGSGKTTDGCWSIFEATHTISGGSHLSTLTLRRPQTEDDGVRPDTLRRVDTRQNTPATLLLNNRWRAAWAA